MLTRFWRKTCRCPCVSLKAHPVLVTNPRISCVKIHPDLSVCWFNLRETQFSPYHFISLSVFHHPLCGSKCAFYSWFFELNMLLEQQGFFEFNKHQEQQKREVQFERLQCIRIVLSVRLDAPWMATAAAQDSITRLDGPASALRVLRHVGTCRHS